MALIQKYKAAAENGDILGVRIMVANSFVNDPSLAEYHEKMNYAKNHINASNLLDIHDGEVLKDKSAWTKDYMNEQLAKVVDNFSTERLELLGKVVRHVYDIKDVNTNVSGQQIKKAPNDGAAGAIVVGGALATAAGIVFTQSVLTCIGAITMVGGIAAIILKDSDKR